MKNMGGRDFQLWDEHEGFFYDVLRYPNGEFHSFRVRSLVGLIPMFAVEVLQDEELKQHSEFQRDLDWFLRNRPELVEACLQPGHARWQGDPRRSLHRRPRVNWSACWSASGIPDEFLSDYGIRSLSKYHREHPVRVRLKHGALRAGRRRDQAEGRQFQLAWAHLVPDRLSDRGIAAASIREALWARLWLEGPDGCHETQWRKKSRPHDQHFQARCSTVAGRCSVAPEKFQNDPHWRDYLLFYEHFHGDNGAGLGASHQTGWTALVANLIDEWRRS